MANLMCKCKTSVFKRVVNIQYSFKRTVGFIFDKHAFNTLRKRKPLNN